MAARHVSLAAGLILTTAAGLALAVVATAGVDIAGTGWTRAGWLAGAVAIGAGVGMLASLAHKPRALRLPIRPGLAAHRSGRRVGPGVAAPHPADHPTVQFPRPRVERFSAGRARVGGGATPLTVTRLLPCVPPERGGVAPAGGGREGWAAASPSTWTARGAATAAGLRTTTNE